MAKFNYEIEIKEQPIKQGDKSIFCTFRLWYINKEGKRHSESIGSNNYFVCDLEKNITLCFNWYIQNQKILKLIRLNGYKYNGK